MKDSHEISTVRNPSRAGTTPLSKHLEAISNDINLSQDKTDASLFPLKPSLSSPGIERPPSNPPNPEVIAAGSFPTWLCSKHPSEEVYADNIQIAYSKFPCGLVLVRMDQKKQLYLRDSVLHNTFKRQE